LPLDLSTKGKDQFRNSPLAEGYFGILWFLEKHFDYVEKASQHPPDKKLLVAIQIEHFA